MRTLIATQPADGHLNPMLGLSGALRAAGHEVTFATSASYVPRIEARGERAIAAGVDWLESGGAIEELDPEADPAKQPTYFERLFLRRTAAQMARDLIDLMHGDRPDVVIREATEFGAAAAAAHHGIPFATFDFSFPIDFDLMSTTGDVRDRGSLDDLRAHAGLPPADDLDWFRGHLTINTLPDGYRGQYGLADPHVLIQPHVLDVVDDADVPAWVHDLDAAVYVSLGTVFTMHFPDVLVAAARGAAASDRHTVVTYGASGDPDELALPDGDGVRVERYVPQGPVLDRCAAAVIHGGTGTTLGALARGVPLVMVPLGADQFGHARAVTEAGAGVRLDHDGLTAQAVAAAIDTVTSDPSYAAAARQVGGQLLSLPGPQAAVVALEALAGRGRPDPARR